MTVILPNETSKRNTVLTDVYRNVRTWLQGVLARAPQQMQGILQVSEISISQGRLLYQRFFSTAQDYIDRPQDSYASGTEMGKSVAIELARAMPASSKECTRYFSSLFDVTQPIS